MRRKGLWLSVLATAMIAGGASADITQSSGVYTYEGNGFNFFTYNTNLYGTQVTSATWDYRQVSESPGTFSNNEHFQQYAPANVIDLMDGNYTHGALSSNPPLGGPYTLGDSRYANEDQIWDNEQLFWNFNSTTSILNIGIVTGFRSEGRPSGNTTYGAGDLFLNFGPATIALPNGAEAPDATGSGNFYDLAIGTGDGRNTGANEWILPAVGAWVDADSDPFDVESDPYRYVSGGTQVDIANVEWTDHSAPSTLNLYGNVHNFLAVAVNLSGHQDWIDSLLGPTGGFGGFTAHWTFGCGNDTIHYTSITPGTNTPVVPVPAAAPMALLGMALVSLVRRKRQAKC